MRLWHEKLIPYLPRQQLLGLHREVCALRGNGWGKKHSTVDYVFTHPYGWLVAYHQVVIGEMLKRGYSVDAFWMDSSYRGEKCTPWGLPEADQVLDDYIERSLMLHDQIETIYPEHNEAYLQECLENLARKGVIIERNAIK